MSDTVTVVFGATSPPLSEQLRGHYSEELLEQMDGFARAILSLHMLDLLTDAETLRARKRLIKLIGKVVSSESVKP